jgi:enolase
MKIMMPAIQRLTAVEILDSRGRPTVQATCELADGSRVVRGTVSVPSGASTGAAEAHELRDGDPGRYRGLGCRKAVAAINDEIDAVIHGHAHGQEALDRALIDLDGTRDKSRLGANAVLAVSLAYARAMAAARGRPLYTYFAEILGRPAGPLPRLTINLFSGGKHAGAQVPIQDVLIVPLSARTIEESLVAAGAVYQSAAELIHRKYGMRLLTADEGGLAPDFSSIDAMLSDAVEAIQLAGYQPGRDVALAVDVASSHFYQGGFYELADRNLTGAGMIAQILEWLARYPIISVEDALAEDDWESWPQLRAAVADRALVLGDDLLCTNPARIRRAIERQAADALLLKVNQVGTLTEAAEAYRLASAAGWQVTVSARSGETEDNWLADLAVGWGGNQIKVGSITQSDRLAKYNRLLTIEAETGLPLRSWTTPGA